jgi:hypothetical protein
MPSISSFKAAILAFLWASISMSHAPLIACAIYRTKVLRPVLLFVRAGSGEGEYPNERHQVASLPGRKLGATRRKLKRRVVGLLGVIGANMGCKLFVALRLEVAHHFIEGTAGWRSRSFKPPATFGTTETPKTLLLNPHQLPPHGGKFYRRQLEWSVGHPTE